MLFSLVFTSSWISALKVQTHTGVLVSLRRRKIQGRDSERPRKDRASARASTRASTKSSLVPLGCLELEDICNESTNTFWCGDGRKIIQENDWDHRHRSRFLFKAFHSFSFP